MKPIKYLNKMSIRELNQHLQTCHAYVGNEREYHTVCEDVALSIIEAQLKQQMVDNDEFDYIMSKDLNNLTAHLKDRALAPDIPLNRHIRIDGDDVTLEVSFYLSNNMPAILGINPETDEPYMDLTTNIAMSFDRSLPVRSDESNKVQILYDNGWITGQKIATIPSGFIDINYYELTDEAIEYITEMAIEQKIPYTVTN